VYPSNDVIQMGGTAVTSPVTKLLTSIYQLLKSANADIIICVKPWECSHYLPTETATSGPGVKIQRDRRRSHRRPLHRHRRGFEGAVVLENKSAYVDTLRTLSRSWNSHNLGNKPTGPPR